MRPPKHLITLVIGHVALAGLTGCSCPSGEEARPGPRLVDGSESNEPCPHPFLPLIEGASWSYQLGEDSTRATRAALRVVDLSKQGRAVTAKIQRTVGPSVTTVEATCGSEGTSFLSFFVPLSPPLPTKLNYVPRITKRTGALLVHPGLMKTGASWSYDVVAHTENPGGKALTMDSEWHVEVQYAGQQIVTVPAGRYDVTQLKLKVTGHHRPPEEDDVTFSQRIMDPPPMGFTYSLAKGVGVVLVEGDPLEGRSGKRAYWALTGVERP